MKAIKGSHFGVRFYRRPAPKAAAAKTPEQQDAKVEKMIDIPEQETVATTDLSSLPMSAKPPGVKEYKLWTAAYHDDCYAIRLLVMDGVDLDARDPKGRTALNIATQYGKGNAVKTLLAAKEMRFMAKVGELPETAFFQKFKGNR